MQFKDVIGQDEIKALLLQQVRERRVPHALLFSGPSGCGKMAMAVAFANYLLCQNPGAEDSCGQCANCRQIAQFGFPDLHFSFPIIKIGSSPTTCADYMGPWMEMLRSTLYFGFGDWLRQMGTDNKQARILEAEGDNIINQMSLTAYSGGYKVMIIWLPEKLNTDAANNLLKMLEEPAPNTVFILVSDDSSKVLTTLVSRTQVIHFRPLQTTTVAQALVDRNGLEQGMAVQIARICNGSYLRALQLINAGDNSKEFFNSFAQLMRLSYARDLPKIKLWSDDAASWGREKLKAFLGYCQNMIRENFMFNFQRPELNFMNDSEQKFAQKFARFINERNVNGFMEEFSKAQRDIEQNVYSRTVLFDFALKCIILLRQ